MIQADAEVSLIMIDSPCRVTCRRIHWDRWTDPIVAEVDLSGIPSATDLIIHFDLLGSGALDSYVLVDNVVVLSDASNLPSANNDSATLDEDVEVAIDVLANDTDSDGVLDANTVTIVDAPATWNCDGGRRDGVGDLRRR